MKENKTEKKINSAHTAGEERKNPKDKKTSQLSFLITNVNNIL